MINSIIYTKQSICKWYGPKGPSQDTQQLNHDTLFCNWDQKEGKGTLSLIQQWVKQHPTKKIWHYNLILIQCVATNSLKTYNSYYSILFHYKISSTNGLVQKYNKINYLHSPMLQVSTISRPRCHSRHVTKLIAEFCFSCRQRRRKRRHLLQSPLRVLTRDEWQQLPLLLRHGQAATLSLLPGI